MTTEMQLLTAEEFLALPREEPAELVEGRVVPMPGGTPRHSAIQGLLVLRLGQFGEASGRGRALPELALRTGPATLRFADVAFLSYERAPDPLPENFSALVPELVVEVVSPSTSWDDLLSKVHEYLALGVEHVWVVSPALRTVVVFRPGAGMAELREGDTLQGEGILDGFSLAITDLFAR